MFELLHTDAKSKARRGRLTTPHGVIETPIFMPVGTQGSVKTLHPDDLNDIAMLFDECPPYPCERKYAEESTHLTTRWGQRCKDWIEANKPQSGSGRQLHFGIVQGSVYPDLRELSARALVDLDLDGYAIGGVSVGEPEAEMFAAIQNAEPFLPQNKPRYAMGLGTPTQLLEMIGQGVDMFDCVHPTRCARHGQAFTPDGPIHIKNKAFEFDAKPLSEDAHPHVARFSRSFLRHSFRAGEIIAQRVLSFHNLHFYLQLMEQARNAISEDRFPEFQKEFVARYTAGKK